MPYWQVQARHYERAADGDPGRRVEVKFFDNDDSEYSRTLWVFFTGDNSEKLGLDGSGGLNNPTQTAQGDTWWTSDRALPKALFLELAYEILDRPFTDKLNRAGVRHHVE